MGMPAHAHSTGPGPSPALLRNCCTLLSASGITVSTLLEMAPVKGFLLLLLFCFFVFCLCVCVCVCVNEGQLKELNTNFSLIRFQEKHISLCKEVVSSWRLEWRVTSHAFSVCCYCVALSWHACFHLVVAV